MDRKYIIIIIAVLAVLAAAGAFLLTSNPMALEHSTIELSETSYIQIPVDSSAISTADEEGIFYYVDKNNGINITHSNPNITTSKGIKIVDKLKNNISVGSKKIIEDNAVIYAKNGIYSIFVKNTKYNDTILIQSTNKNILLQCWESLKFHSPTDSLKIEDTDSKSVVNATQTTQKVVSKSPTYSSASSSSTSSSKSSSSSSSSGRSIEDDFGPTTSTKSYSSSSKSYSSGSKKSSSSGSIESEF